MYDSGRYFTVTGHRYGRCTRIRDCQAAIQVLHGTIFPPTSRPPPTPSNRLLQAQELLYRAFTAKNGHRFASLWEGDISNHTSHSEADLALCNFLAFWTGGDYNLMDELFRQSGLYRPKWDENHYADGRTYGQATIAKALADCTAFYNPSFRP
jgi:putative DNA primase/helicase